MIDHPFVPDPHGRDVCDKKVDDDGRSRLCGVRRVEHRPVELPKSVRVGLIAGHVDLLTKNGRGRVSGYPLTPVEARAVARELLLKAEEVEREAGRG